MERKRVPASGKLLDLGCGRGRNGIALAKLGFEVYGVDISANALKDYKEKINAEHLGKRIKLFNGSMIKRLPFEDDVFSVVVDLTAFFHIADRKGRQSYISEVSRVLKPGGLMLQYQISPKDEYYSSLKTNADGIFIDRNGITGRLYTRDELIALFSKNFRLLIAKTLIFEDKSRDTRYYRKPGKSASSLVIFKKL